MPIGTTKRDTESERVQLMMSSVINRLFGTIISRRSKSTMVVARICMRETLPVWPPTVTKSPMRIGRSKRMINPETKLAKISCKPKPSPTVIAAANHWTLCQVMPSMRQATIAPAMVTVYRLMITIACRAPLSIGKTAQDGDFQQSRQGLRRHHGDAKNDNDQQHIGQGDGNLLRHLDDDSCHQCWSFPESPFALSARTRSCRAPERLGTCRPTQTRPQLQRRAAATPRTSWRSCRSTTSSAGASGSTTCGQVVG